MTKYLLIVCLLHVLPFFPLRAQDLDLTILDNWIAYSDSENTLYRHITNQARHLLNERKQALGELHTLADWQRRQETIKKTLHDIVGPFPERTPLNVRVTGTLERAQFTVEKILYESQPGYYVTAALFIPRNIEGSAPGILFCSGHTSNGFRSETYQTMILNLVRKGFVVLAFDPTGQGERSVYFSDTKEPYPGGPTHQHSYPGVQQFILGQSPARSMIWDGIRGIDYLVSRPEVDPDRIGVAGRSGGGTQSAYIAAFDDRVLAAAPEAYIAGFSRLLDSRGPQDAEQNFFHGIRAGIDHGDLLAVRAPRPALIISTTRDFFSIQGARETYDEVKHIYSAYQAPDAISMVEDDAEHASTVKNREAMYAFFMRVFETSGSPAEEDIPLFTEAELQVTPQGEVALLPGARSIFSLIQDDAEAALKALLISRRTNPDHFDHVREQAILRSGYQKPDTLRSPIFAGRYHQEGYYIEKYIIEGEGQYPIPYLVFTPDKPGPHPVLFYLDPEGKPSDPASLDPLKSWVREGYLVVTPDLPGMGELGPGALRGDSYIDGISLNVWFGALLIGRSLTAIQAGDLNQVIQAIKQRADIDALQITGIASHAQAPVLLHAAIAEPSFHRVILIAPLVSNERLVMEERYKTAYIPGIVAGSLPHYDIPDLAGSLAPLEITLMHPVNPVGAPVSEEAIQEAWDVARKRYEVLGVPERLEVIPSDGVSDFYAVLNALIIR